ncbi:MAG: SCO family protein [Paracoccaceae bacterium]
MRATLAVALGLVGLIFAGAGALFVEDLRRWAAGPTEVSSPILVRNAGGAAIGGPFTLTNQHGRTVTSEEIVDGPTLLYFGYTYCPDVCPFDATILADATRLLAERGIEVTPVFVSVDPERDTPDILAEWAAAHHPDMVALTGSAEAVRAAADAYRVYYERVEAEGSAAEYLVNHTAFTYLVTPEGLQAIFRRELPFAEMPEEMADTVAALIAS